MWQEINQHVLAEIDRLSISDEERLRALDAWGEFLLVMNSLQIRGEGQMLEGLFP